MKDNKYLFIVTESELANGICAKKVMNCLSSSGYKVYCLTNREYGMDKTFTENGVEYFTVKQRFVYRIDSYLRHGKPSPLRRKLLTVVFKVLNKLKLATAYFSWPLISPVYCRRYYKAAKKLVCEQGITCMIPIYKQIDPLIAADKIKKQFPDVKLIPCFLDSLSGGAGPKIFSEKKTFKRGLYYKKRVLRRADSAIVMESSRAHHEKKTAGYDFYSKLNYLDIPLLSEFKVPSGIKAPDMLEDGKVNLLFIGTVIAHIRNPQKLFEVFSSLEGDDLRLNIVGTNDCPDLIRSATQRDPRIKVFPFVSHDEVMTLIDRADVLVNLGNNISSMVPSKIFEYMSTGKPIISTAPISDEPSAKYLKHYALSYILDESDYDKDKAVSELDAFLSENGKRRLPFSDIKKTFYSNTPEAFCDFLRENG